MFDLSDSLEAIILSAKKLCNKIEMSIDGCNDADTLKKIFHIHRHLRDVLRELELDDISDYNRHKLLIMGLEEAFKKALNVQSLA